MYDIFRDSAVGYTLRLVTRGRVASYPEQDPGFKIPDESFSRWHRPDATSTTSKEETEPQSGHAADDVPRPDIEARKEGGHSCIDAEKQEQNDAAPVQDQTSGRRPRFTKEREEQQTVLVSWYSDDDPDDPHNWSTLKKSWLSFVIMLYTFSVYVGSSLYVASVPDIIHIYHVPQVVASLGLSLYVLGYGLGPMLLSPLSEIPAIGRNPPYVTTLAVFVLLCVPTSLINSFPGLLVLRFLLGFFGSPGLATGGASLGDFYGTKEMPYVIAAWGGGATLAPALGPLIGGFAVQYVDWRWSSWLLLCLSGLALLLMFFSLPETSADNILLRRVRRLRARARTPIPSNSNSGKADAVVILKSESEIRQSESSPRRLGFDALIKPWQINLLDPAVAFSTVYTALTYAIYYSFFESFTLVYGDMYGFDLAQIGLAFLALLAGLVVAVVLYCLYLHRYGDAKIARLAAETTTVPPEARLWPGLVATFCIPIGLFIFAWTARPHVHWIVSLVGAAVSMTGVFIITQCMFIYLPFTYPRYSGSLFAANGFARSACATGAVLYARPMFARLGIAGGVSLLAGLTVLCTFGIYVLYFYGARLRRKSRFAVS
ncbi:hypothetical protein A1O1_04848 [Capronia coronata CBS 617.96]|uniref:Major facilitator superfamily (MFS) profile domain-containing protein n=1 Tax=Capronia coronata CBS 617.96 TaxID=1182541 RepID=W9YFA2_9EURO|nr:uncharacterized protein A1O1_04848 [Capronia coronata CBS 617.96]EXJ87921.1 hypothetical protein A1O1_04848 [Capronia coronata CBS 617.96]